MIADLFLDFARWEPVSAPPTMSIFTWIAQEPLITLVNGRMEGVHDAQRLSRADTPLIHAAWVQAMSSMATCC